MNVLMITALLAMMVAAGCSSAVVETLIDGMWGGEHIILRIYDTHRSSSWIARTVPSTYRFGWTEPAASASPAPSCSREGPQEDVPEESYATTYSDRIDSIKMNLAIDVADQPSWPAQTFELVKGQEGRLVKCL